MDWGGSCRAGETLSDSGCVLMVRKQDFKILGVDM